MVEPAQQKQPRRFGWGVGGNLSKKWRTPPPPITNPPQTAFRYQVVDAGHRADDGDDSDASVVVDEEAAPTNNNVGVFCFHCCMLRCFGLVCLMLVLRCRVVGFVFGLCVVFVLGFAFFVVA